MTCGDREEEERHGDEAHVGDAACISSGTASICCAAASISAAAAAAAAAARAKSAMKSPPTTVPPTAAAAPSAATAADAAAEDAAAAAEAAFADTHDEGVGARAVPEFAPLSSPTLPQPAGFDAEDEAREGVERLEEMSCSSLKVVRRIVCTLLFLSACRVAMRRRQCTLRLRRCQVPLCCTLPRGVYTCQKRPSVSVKRDLVSVSKET
jgi:hypothetical protein